MRGSIWIVGIIWLGVAAGAAAELPEGRDFGAGIAGAPPTALAEIVRAPERHTEAPSLLRGRLAEVCQRKGCWTVLQDGAHQIRVRFEDYGFFLPKDAAGEEALVEGVVTIRTLSEREARHLEEESRDGDPDAVDGPQREVGFLASGVRLLGRAPAP